MIYAKPLLEEKGKKASDFINWISDERKSLGLEKFAGEEMIVIDANSGSGNKIYIDERIKYLLNEFLSQ